MDNLKLGLSVIADSCNPIQLSRDEWDRERIVIDTANKSIDESLNELIGKIQTFTELQIG